INDGINVTLSNVINTQYCIENPGKAFVEYASSCTDEARGKWYTFKLLQNNLGDTYNLSWRSHPNLSPNDDMPEVDERKGECNLKNTNTIEFKEQQRATPQLELNDPTAISKTGPSRSDEEG
nr:hypothetical protein [Tanacetum cinerariifolium]